MILLDCRHSEAARHADEVVIIRPGTDAALALALAHVIVAEGLVDQAFTAAHTVGYDAFAAALAQYTPAWAEAITGVEAATIVGLARCYAHDAPAMIVLGGSSIFKHQHGWEAGRAIATLPALTGQLGIAGGGFGPRHRGFTHGAAFAALEAFDCRPPGNYIPNHMPSIAAAIGAGALDVLLLCGSNMLSSFADAGALVSGLERTGLIIGYDIFMNDTLRAHADLVLPGTVWLEELGIKDTATHIYLMERALAPRGQARSLDAVLRALAERLVIADFYPWADEEAYINAWLAPQADKAGPLTVARLRTQNSYHERTGLSHVAYPDHRYHTPSGKIEFWSERARAVGLSPLPTYRDSSFTSMNGANRYPLQLGQGRTLTHFHSFYDAGRALPSLAKLNKTPELWLNPVDAAQRDLAHGEEAELHNERGALAVMLRVTEDVPRGVVWLRDGWWGMNHLTNGEGALDATAADLIEPFRIPGGQAAYDARVDVRRGTSRECSNVVSAL